MAQIQGTVIAAQITTGDTLNTFPVADVNELQGGLMSVADLTARDAIPSTRRKVGMEVFVSADGLTYQLYGGTANINWRERPGGGSAEITKQAVETVLTGEITSHTHPLDIDMGNAFSIEQFDPTVDIDIDGGNAFDL